LAETRLLKITIVNWDKYQSGRSGKHYPWFKFYHRMIDNPVIDGLSAAEFKIWIYVLVLCNRQGGGILVAQLSQLVRTTRAQSRHILRTLTKLEENQIVKLENAPLYKNRIEEIKLETTIAKRAKKIVLKPNGNEHQPKTHLVWESYRKAYFEKYGVNPKRNAKINGQVCQLISRLGESDAIEVVRFYVAHNDRWYVRQGHSLGLCLKDCEKLFMEWQSGKRVTSVTAAKIESMDHNATVVANYLKKSEQLELEREVHENGTLEAGRVFEKARDPGRDLSS
jgi:hypothetical protein